MLGSGLLEQKILQNGECCMFGRILEVITPSPSYSRLAGTFLVQQMWVCPCESMVSWFLRCVGPWAKIIKFTSTKDRNLPLKAPLSFVELERSEVKCAKIATYLRLKDRR